MAYSSKRVVFFLALFLISACSDGRKGKVVDTASLHSTGSVQTSDYMQSYLTHFKPDSERIYDRSADSYSAIFQERGELPALAWCERECMSHGEFDSSDEVCARQCDPDLVYEIEGRQVRTNDLRGFHRGSRGVYSYTIEEMYGRGPSKTNFADQRHNLRDLPSLFWTPAAQYKSQSMRTNPNVYSPCLKSLSARRGGISMLPGGGARAGGHHVPKGCDESYDPKIVGESSVAIGIVDDLLYEIESDRPRRRIYIQEKDERYLRSFACESGYQGLCDETESTLDQLGSLTDGLSDAASSAGNHLKDSLKSSLRLLGERFSDFRMIPAGQRCSPRNRSVCR